MRHRGVLFSIRTTLAAFALCAVLAACGTSHSQSTASTHAGNAQATHIDASAVLARDYKGVIEPVPATGPAAVAHKTIWFSNCVAFEGCQRFARGVMAAAKVLGWTIKEVDNKNEPQVSISIIRDAIAAKANGVIDTLSNCPDIKAGLVAANAAHIPVISYAGLDCANPAFGHGGQSLFAAPVRLGKAADSLQYYRNQGMDDAEYVLALAAKQGIAAPSILTALPGDQLFQKSRSQGFASEISVLCPSCKVIPINFTVTQAVAGGAQIIKSGILQNPTSQIFYYGNDAFLPLGIQSALQSNRGHFKILCCGDGGALSTANVRQGSLAGTVAANFAPLEMWGWDTLDVMNRVIAGKSKAQIPAEGNVTFYFDRQHNLPASGPVAVPYDYAKAFTTVWKGSSK